jgi:hypothetical protein
MDTMAVIIVAEAFSSARRTTTTIIMITHTRMIAAGYIAEPCRPEAPIGGAVIEIASTEADSLMSRRRS